MCLKKIVLRTVLILSLALSMAVMVFAYEPITTDEMNLNIETDPYAYGKAADGMRVFVYHGASTSLFDDVDLSECTENRLYVYNKEQNTITEICNQPVVEYAETQDAVYYVTEQQILFKTDYSGSNHVPLYACKEGEIDSLTFYFNKLYFVENEYQVVMLDTVKATSDIVLRGETLDWIFILNETELIVVTLAEDYFIYNRETMQSTNISAVEATYHINHAVLGEAISNVPDASVMAVYSNSYNTQDNDVSFPLSEYPAQLFDSNVVYNFNHLRPLSWFHVNGQEGCSGTNCKSYGGTAECEAFAMYAHDVYTHTVDYTINHTSTWLASKHNDNDNGVPKRIDTESAAKDFFNNLHTGDYVRYGKDSDSTPNDGVHSIVFLGKTNAGIWVYECNQSYYDSLSAEEKGEHLPDYFGCGVHLQFYTYWQISYNYDYILHHVAHNYENVYASSTTHHAECTKCSGYLIQTHTGAMESTYHGITLHTNTYSCCSGSALSAHTSSRVLTVYSATHHMRTYGCCTGGELKTHTGTTTITSVNAFHHIVSATCCTGTVSEPHTWGARDACIYCGYCDGLEIMNQNPEETTE